MRDVGPRPIPPSRFGPRDTDASPGRGELSLHGNHRARTQPGRVHRLGKPRHGVPEPAQDRFDIQKVLERLVEKGKIVVKKAYADWSRFQDYTGALARGGHRADRDPPPRARPARTRPTSACVVDAMDLAYSQGAHRHLRDRLRRQRLLAAGLQAQGERQARHRPGHEGLDLGPAPRQLRRVHLLRGPRAAGAGRPADRDQPRRRPPRAQAQGLRPADRGAASRCGGRTRRSSTPR